MSKHLIIGGTYDDGLGQTSGYVQKLCRAIIEQRLEEEDWQALNGGSYQLLVDTMPLMGEYQTVIWMPNISNDKPKLVGEIKKMHPHLTLVTSKRNEHGDYGFMDLVARALSTKSNLMIEFRQDEPDGLWAAGLLDPLGNYYCAHVHTIGLFARALLMRLRQLSGYSRVGSRKVGEAEEIPDQPEFFDIVRGYADRFHELIHAVNQDRMLGNASFRCTEGGFPSFRYGGGVFVSKRNLDKRDIGKDGFVQVSATPKQVMYWGDEKPSVDTPIHYAIYNALPRYNYMIHSHTYVEGAPFTDKNKVIPCGAVEETEEILRAYIAINPIPDGFFAINLNGHGSLVAADKVSKLKDIPYIARTIPESQYCVVDRI